MQPIQMADNLVRRLSRLSPHCSWIGEENY